MKKYNKAIGNYGETLAGDFLINNGYNILDINYRNKYGEIDIICRKNNIKGVGCNEFNRKYM